MEALFRNGGKIGALGFLFQFDEKKEREDRQDCADKQHDEQRQDTVLP